MKSVCLLRGTNAFNVWNLTIGEVPGPVACKMSCISQTVCVYICEKILSVNDVT